MVFSLQGPANLSMSYPVLHRAAELEKGCLESELYRAGWRRGIFLQNPQRLVSSQSSGAEDMGKVGEATTLPWFLPPNSPVLGKIHRKTHKNLNV